MWLVGMPFEDAVGSDVICVSGVGGQVQLEREERAQQGKPIWGQAISPTLPRLIRNKILLPACQPAQNTFQIVHSLVSVRNLPCQLCTDTSYLRALACFFF